MTAALLERDPVRAELRDALVALRDRAEKPLVGICTGVGWISYDAEDLLRSMFYDWPEFSGSVYFPVEGSASKYAGSNRWSKSSKYGRARWRLLNYLIDTLE